MTGRITAARVRLAEVDLVKGPRTVSAVYLCGVDETPGPRVTDCPSPLHDHPLPVGYVGASEVAGRRLREHWSNHRCRACGVYGWVPPPDGQPAGVKR